MDAQAARHKRRGKADRRYAAAIARSAGKHELRCPRCNTREVHLDRERGGTMIFVCKKNHAWTSAEDQRAYRATFGTSA